MALRCACNELAACKTLAFFCSQPETILAAQIVRQPR